MFVRNTDVLLLLYGMRLAALGRGQAPSLQGVTNCIKESLSVRPIKLFPVLTITKQRESAGMLPFSDMHNTLPAPFPGTPLRA